MFSTIVGTGDGSAPVVNLTFPILNKAHVKATANGVAVTFTWTGASQITFSAGVPAGQPWKVYRDSSLSAALVDYTDGAILTEVDLDKGNLQHLYLEQELSDALAIETASRAALDSALEERARDAIGSALVEGVGIDINVNDAAETITISSAAGAVGSQGYATRAALAAAPTANGAISLLGEARREGTFVFDPSDLSVQVAADTQQGVYVAPAAAPTGATGAWVRKYSGPLDIRWFGAVADATAVGVGTDNAAAINGAIAVAALTKGAEVHIPRSTLGYRVGSTLTFTGGVKLTGDGFSQNPGQVGATVYPDPQNIRGSMLVFDANIAGVKFFAFTDNLGNAQAFEFESAVFSTVRDLFLHGGGGTSITAHGFEARAALDVQNVTIFNFAGEGLRIQANTFGGFPYGNANSSHYKRVRLINNGLHGLHIAQSVDANSILFENLYAQGNGGWGILDEGSIGGNTYIAPELSLNNASFGAATPQRTQVLADLQGALLANQDTGSICVPNGAAVGSHGFYNAYVEITNGKKAYIPQGVVAGGILADISQALIIDAGGTFPTTVNGFSGEIRVSKIRPGTTGGSLSFPAWTLHTLSTYPWPVSNAAVISYNVDWGMLVGGQGGTYDITLLNNAGNRALSVPTGTLNVELGGSVKLATGVAVSMFDTDVLLGANSDTRVATQKAVKAYVDTAVVGLLDHKGVLDASTNPNYPAASKGDVYIISVAGKVGGASGVDVNVGDAIIARADNAGGTQAAVGASWDVLEHNLPTLATVATTGSASDLSAGTLTRPVSAAGPILSVSLGGIGYGVGAGGSVVQATSKSTGVTLNKDAGNITTNNAALAAAALVSFTVTNSEVGVNDGVVLTLKSGNATAGTYRYWVEGVAAGSFKVVIENRSAGSLSEALVFNFQVIKGSIT